MTSRLYDYFQPDREDQEIIDQEHEVDWSEKDWDKIRTHESKIYRRKQKRLTRMLNKKFKKNRNG